ncbi:hypothetical protein QDY63_14855 [Pseudomonas brenneri]|uniref:hypothetical protein n=1 Tax=Pseudomonas brenneri TaxID=129817 RepID=UPI0025A1737E|nr:hypothetical protein [Pseudomonas brenneri]WJM88680.1 hypothetical protein QDY63_14855 [Pseudomonas brenneri]
MKKSVDVEVPENQFHYFGSTALNWCKDTSPENVLFTLARMAGTETIKQQVKCNKGLYAWVCRVEQPQTTKYEINNFAPAGVKVSESWEFNIMNAKGHCLPITREKGNAKT